MAGQSAPKPLQQQPGDRMSTRDHASAIEGVLAEHFDEDFNPRDGAGSDDAPANAREEELDARRQLEDEEQGSRRERRRRGSRDEEARDEEEQDDGDEDEGDDRQSDEEAADDTDDDGAEDEREEDDDEQSDDDDTIRNIDELAEALDATADDVMESLSIKMDDGEEVSLKELRAGFMRDSDYRQKTEEVATRRREVDDAAAKQSDLAEKATLVNSQLVQAARNAVAKSMDSPEMKKLEREDPSRFLLVERDINRRVSALGQVQQQAVEHLKSIEKDRQERANRELQEYIATERAELQKALGGEVPAEKREALLSFLESDLGMTGEEFGTYLSHKAVLAFVRLMERTNRLKELEAGDPERGRKVEEGTRRGRLRKRGKRGGKGRRGAQRERQRQSDAARQQARKTGSVKDAAAAIDSLI